jgi:mono/diheme cytochrome c family protein
MRNYFILFVLFLASCGNGEDPSLRQLHKSSSSENLSGKQLYMTHCIACHQADAMGVKGTFPPIKNSDYFLEDPKRAIHNILFGQAEPIIVNGENYQGLMPPVKITDAEVVKVVNYLLKEVNNVEQRISLKDVEWVRENR